MKNKMIPFLMVIALTGHASAKGVQVKGDQCGKDIPNGSICYSEKEANEIDISQKAILSCQAKLSACQNKSAMIQPLLPPKSIYQKQWFRDTVLGVIVFSAGVMIGVAASD